MLIDADIVLKQFETEYVIKLNGDVAQHSPAI